MNYLEEELQQLLIKDKHIYRFITDAALDGVWFWDLENPEYEWMNEKFWHTLGYDPNEKAPSSSEWQKLINPEDMQIALKKFAAHCEDPSKPFDQIVRYRHANGSTLWLRARGIAIRDEHGKPTRMLGAHTDVTQLKLAELRYADSLNNIDRLYAETKIALEESEQIFNAMPDAVLQVDTSGNIVKVNSKACEMFGYSLDEFNTLNIDSLVPKPHQAHHHMKREKYNEQPVAREMSERKIKLSALCKNGKELPVHIRLSPIETKYGKHILAVVRDISATAELQASLQKTQQHNKELYEQSIKDNLTKAYNRMYFMEQAKIELQRAKRLQVPTSLLMIDIDDFKHINDTYGHQEGDKVLIEVSRTIASVLRTYDIFARYGGEEFVILMPETHANEACVVADRILKRLSNDGERTQTGLKIMPTASIGGVSTSGKEYDLDKMISLADIELYKAKHRGKNNVSFMKH